MAESYLDELTRSIGEQVHASDVLQRQLLQNVTQHLDKLTDAHRRAEWAKQDMQRQYEKLELILQAYCPHWWWNNGMCNDEPIKTCAICDFEEPGWADEDNDGVPRGIADIAKAQERDPR